MTIAQTGTQTEYPGDGASTAFPFGFRFFDDTDLIVTLTSAAGVGTVQVLTTNYTVSNTGTEAGGTVTMLVAPASGETLTIDRVLPLTQLTDYRSGDAFPAESHEGALDRQTLIAQQQQAIIGASVTMADGTGAEISAITAGAAVIGNATGDGFIPGPTADEIEDAQANATAAAASAAAAAASENAAAADAALLGLWRGAWVTATAYALGDRAQESGSTYICVVAHTSGTFATDLAAVKWQIFAQKGAAGAGTGDLLATNNLSDLAAPTTTAVGNLGLANVATLKSVYNLTGGDVNYVLTAGGTAGYVTGEKWWVRPNINAGASVNIARDGLANKAVKLYDESGTLVAAAGLDWKHGNEKLIEYDGTQWVIILERIHRGTAARQIPQLDGSGSLPAVGGAALTSSPAPGYVSAGQTITSGGSLTLAHGLGARPSRREYTLVCTATDGPFSVGQEFEANLNSSGPSTDRVNRARFDATNIVIRFASASQCFVLGDNSGNGYPLNNTKWDFYVRAWK